jgi:ATP synthase protein I
MIDRQNNLEKRVLSVLNPYYLFPKEPKDLIIRKARGEALSPKTSLRRWAEISSLVLTLPSSIAVGLFMGYYLDKFFRTHPWLLLTFTVLGVISGLLSLYRGLKKYQGEFNQNQRP